MIKPILSILSGILLSVVAFAQTGNTYNLIENGEGCNEFVQLYKSFPKNATYSLEIIDKQVFFVTNNEKVFETLFDHKTDGIALDIVSKSQYQCGMPIQKTSWASKGKLLAPIYQKELHERIQSREGGAIVVDCGQLPSYFNKSTHEVNLVVIQKQSVCEYKNSLNLTSDEWSITDINLHEYQNAVEDVEFYYQNKNKKISTSIFFEKEEYSFDSERLTNIFSAYDTTSLHITDATIRVFNSVDETANDQTRELGSERIAEIISVLQPHQASKIIPSTHVQTNWAELTKDITGSSYAYLLKMKKQEVMDELQKEELVKELEPILKKHRRAMVELTIGKRIADKDMAPERLKAKYLSTLSHKAIQEATHLQNTLYERIRDGKIDNAFLDDVKIPFSIEFAPLLNNKICLAYELKKLGAVETYEALNKLRGFIAKFPEIQYNIATVKLKSWVIDETLTTEPDLFEELEKLKRLNVDSHNTARLYANYYLLKSYYDAEKGNDKARERSMNSMYSYSTNANLSNKDIYNISLFYTKFNMYEEARKIIAPRISTDSPDENLLFHFIALSAQQGKDLEQTYMQELIRLAVGINPKRFCNMFNSKADEGLSFQLLEHSVFQNIHCETCDSMSSMR